MHFSQKTILAALSGASLASAHGFVQTITAGGASFDGPNPHADGTGLPGWKAQNGDLGFVEPNSAGTADVICHKSAANGQAAVPVAAGGTVTVQWNTWPESHKGPVIDYLAKCSNGDCTSVSKTDLKFFKIAEKGLTGSSWAADELIAAGNKWDIKIPSDIAAGQYVLRHEIIALHSAGSQNGAQLYPQCINIEVTGGGSANPTGVAGTSLYKATDDGIIFNLYNNPTSYPIPGPALYTSGSSKARRSHARDVKME